MKDHEQDLGEFRREAISGKKDPIKKYAAETLPVLQSNLKQAREMEQAALRKEESKRSPDAWQHR